MGFKFHNTVKIEYNGKTVISPNAVLDFKSAVYANKAFSQFLLAGNAAATFKEKTSLNYINADVLKGGLCAEYSAVFASENFDGKTFSQCGLSADGINFCNIAHFEPFVKEAGKNVCITVTVFLSGENLAVCGGDNPLVKLLLGYKPLDNAGCVSTDFNMNTATYHGDFLPADIKSASCVFSEDGINLNADITDIKAETIFTFAGKPAIKISNFENSIITANAIGVPNVEKCLDLGYKNIYRVNLTNQSGIMSGTVLIHNFDKIVKTDSILNFRTGKNSYIKSDIYNKHLALSCGNEVHFYSEENGQPVYKFKAESGKYGYDVLIGGYLAVFDGGVKIYDSNGDIIYNLNIPIGENSVIVNEGPCFHLATVIDKTVRRYKIANGAYSSLNSFTYSIKPVIFRNFTKIAIAGKYLGYYYDSTNAVAGIDVILYSLFNKYGNISHSGFGDNIAYIESDTGKRFVNLADGAEINVDIKDTCKIFGTIVLKISGNAKQLYYYDRGKRVLTQVNGNVDTKNISSVCRFGEYIVVLSNDGKFDTYYANKNGGFVYNPSFSTETSAVITLQYKQQQNITKKLSVTAKVTVEN